MGYTPSPPPSRTEYLDTEIMDEGFFAGWVGDWVVVLGPGQMIAYEAKEVR